MMANVTHYMAPMLLLLAFSSRNNLGPALVSSGLCVTGVAFIFDVGERGSGGTRPELGLVCGLASAIFYAANIFFSKKAAAEVDAYRNLFWQRLPALAVACCCCLFVEGHFWWGDLLPPFVGGVIIAGVGSLMFLAALPRNPIETSSMLTLVEPVMASVLGCLFFREPITLGKLLGLVCVLGGVLVLFKSGQHVHSEEDNGHSETV